MSWSRLDLGVGLIVAPGLDLLWDGISDLVDVLEVEPQTMWHLRPEGGWDLNEPAFQWVADRGIPTLAHGVGFPVGGCEPPDPAGVALAAQCAARLGAAHWSEHLSFNRVRIGEHGVDAGFLLPPAQTQAGVEAAAEHAAAYHAGAPLPFLIETGTSYLRPRPGELRDGEFIAAVAQRADCGILLDLHNLLANQRNGRQPVAEVLAELPLERVLEVHLAGGFELDGYYLDAHVGGPDSELIALAAEVLPRLPNLRALLFEAMPESLAALGVPGVRAVLTGMRQLWAGRGDRLTDRLARGTERVGWLTAAQAPARDATAAERAATVDWERRLAGYTSRVFDQPPADDPGIGLLRLLADQSRLGELTLARPGLLRSLILGLGPGPAEDLLRRYLADRPPQRWTAREGEQFDSWLARNAPER